MFIYSVISEGDSVAHRTSSSSFNWRSFSSSSVRSGGGSSSLVVNGFLNYSRFHSEYDLPVSGFDHINSALLITSYSLSSNSIICVKYLHLIFGRISRLFRIASIHENLLTPRLRGRSRIYPRIAMLFSLNALLISLISLACSITFPLRRSSMISHSKAPNESINSMGFPSLSYSGLSSNSFIRATILSISLLISICSISAFYSSSLQKVVRPTFGLPIIRI